MSAPTYLPEAIPTALGWAHPLTGEQLDVTSGLDNPVDFYNPNARNASFIDPEGEAEFLAFSVATGRKVRIAIHTLHPVVNVEWDFDDGSDLEVGGWQIRHVFPEETEETEYTVSGTVTYLVDGEEGPEEETEVVTLTVTIPASVEPEPASAPVNTTPLAVTGEAEVGVELVVVPGIWTGNPAPVLTYQWQTGDGEDFTDIEGETAATYTLIEDDLAAHIQVVETATNTEGAVSVTSATIGPITGA